MRDWLEFVRGEEYSVELAAGDERVLITMVEGSADDSAHVLVRGELGGRLFLLALGSVTYELAANSDDLSVSRWEGPDAIESAAATERQTRETTEAGMNFDSFEWHDLPLTSLRIDDDSVELLVTPFEDARNAYAPARLTVTQAEHLSVQITAQMTGRDLARVEVAAFDREHHEDGRVSGMIGILPGNAGYWTISFVRAQCVLEPAV